MNNSMSSFQRGSVIIKLFFAFLISILLTSMFLWLNGFSPVYVFLVILDNTWQSKSGILILLNKTMVFILAGLAVVIPYRAGLFNIGGEGQLIIGGFAAAVVGTLPIFSLGFFHSLSALLVGILCGALWGVLAALLKTWRGIHEVISTIMLNFIALQCINELTFGVFRAEEGSSRTAIIQESAELPLLAQFGSTYLSIGIIIAGIIAIIFSFFLYHTWQGFQLRAVGNNPTACAYSGISVPKIHWLSMFLGGGCAGLAGAIQTLGVDHTFYARFVGGSGFDGITVAFLALAEPWATIPSALFLATLRAADRALQLDVGLPKEFVFMLEGILIVCIAIFMRKRTDTNL